MKTILQTTTFLCTIISIYSLNALHIAPRHLTRHLKYNNAKKMISGTHFSDKKVKALLNTELSTNAFATTMNICAPFIAGMSNMPIMFILPVIPQIIRMSDIALTKRQLNEPDAPLLVKDLMILLSNSTKNKFINQTAYEHEKQQIFEKHKDVDLDKCINYSEKWMCKGLAIEQKNNALHSRSSLCFTLPTFAFSIIFAFFSASLLNNIDALQMLLSSFPGIFSGIIAAKSYIDDNDQLSLFPSQYKQKHKNIITLLEDQQRIIENQKENTRN